MTQVAKVRLGAVVVQLSLLSDTHKERELLFAERSSGECYLRNHLQRTPVLPQIWLQSYLFATIQSGLRKLLAW